MDTDVVSVTLNQMVPGDVFISLCVMATYLDQGEKELNVRCVNRRDDYSSCEFDYHFLFRRVEQKDTIVCAHFTENLEFDPFFLHGTIIADEK